MISVAQLVIARLKTQFSDVEGLMALSDLGDKNVPRKTLFVVEMAEQPGQLVDGTGLYRHEITSTIGVLLVVPARNNAQPDITADRQQIRDLLYGWTPDDDYEPLYLGGGQLQPSRPGIVAWVDRFITQYTEDAVGV
ncbi:hypothetical protein KDN34_02920 [Shewanella yunxiaonensis]|uniref:Uncharacterized protein n=1 Tax=Shewanella yunxiaonensis TaxID=2829809 RepID=A0ABX7YUP9_9GAMM|nr:hypothetical protein [Shewanella yunxiaonensis]QUN06432.1 hypothetical protein KDN34_02920 [Shewanella yunxiaonensis]